MTWVIVLYVLFKVIFFLRGVEQGILYGMKGADSFKWNEHIVLGAVRVLIVGAVIVGGIVGEKNIAGLVAIVIAFIPSFWFWHNTAYYYTRHMIDSRVYPDWLTANSKTSSASINVPFVWRIIGLVISVIFFVLIVL